MSRDIVERGTIYRGQLRLWRMTDLHQSIDIGVGIRIGYMSQPSKLVPLVLEVNTDSALHFVCTKALHLSDKK